MAARKKKTGTEELSFPTAYSVLAADLSLNRPGFSKLRIQNGQIVNVDTWSIDNKTKKTNKHIGEILKEIADWFDNALDDNNVKFFVREKAVKNYGRTRGSMATSAILQVVGIADYMLHKKKGASWYEIYPVSVKKLITGNGKAEKQEVADALIEYVGSHEYKNDDESDATAVGIAWLVSNNQIKQIIRSDDNEA